MFRFDMEPQSIWGANKCWTINTLESRMILYMQRLNMSSHVILVFWFFSTGRTRPLLGICLIHHCQNFLFYWRNNIFKKSNVLQNILSVFVMEFVKMDIKAILVFKIFLTNIAHERLTITGMNILYVPLDVVMFDHFATQNTLIPSVHTPHKSLWKIRQLVNSFWRNSMGFSEMAEPMMPCFESHTTNITWKVQRQVESFNVLLKICSLWSSLPAFWTLPTLIWHHSWQWCNLLINITIWRIGRVKTNFDNGSPNHIDTLLLHGTMHNMFI